MPKGVYKHTEKSKQQLSRIRLKRKEKLGYLNSLETRKKISKSHLGKKHTSETKNKMGKAHKGNKSSFWKGGLCQDMKKYNKDWRKKNMEKVLYWNLQWKIRRKSVNGTHTLEEWLNLKAQYNWTCPACRRREPQIRLTEDHIIPTSKGGSNNIENIQPLCRNCNSKKNVRIVKY
jgi:5-methylcytosine-specific restriction endonuclease McrA